MNKDGKKSKKTAAYTYDLLGRIKKETKTGSEDISYTYDSSNNRKQMKAGNKITAYKYNKNDELLRTDTLNTDTEEDSVVIYKNDKNGNQLATVNRYEIPSEKKNDTYVDIDVTLGDNRLNENVVNHYNALNQLTQTLTKNYKVSFTYDAEGLRTSKTVNGEKTVFVWDGDQLVLELSESGKVQKRYVRGNDLVYADKGNSTEKQFYVTDPHGNVVQLMDESGKVTKTYEYDSFGNEVKLDSKDDNPFRYCGEYYDKETEEVYLRARYYQPEAGRFLTRDSYIGEEDDPLSLHLYVYCGNDGVNAWDPSGHKKSYKDLKNTKKCIYIKARLHLDADGSPRAYHPDNTKGLDLNANGKDGAILKKKGKCVIQKKGKYKGYYVSTTSLVNSDYRDVENMKRYVNSEIIPYIVYSDVVTNKGAKQGNICYVWDKETKKGSFAILADSGPSGEFGEGSIELGRRLGIKLSEPPRIVGIGIDNRRIQYVIFKNTKIKRKGNRTFPENVNQIEKAGKSWVKKFGKKKFQRLFDKKNRPAEFLKS